MRKTILIALCAAFVALAQIPPAFAAEMVYPILFPVVGENRFSDTYDSPRGGGRLHEATDIMAAKMTPVVAAASGTIRWVSTGSYTDCNGSTAPSFSLRLDHDDGYQSWYIHLNNDTPGTDDGKGVGYAPGIVPGAKVKAGQLIGWVGDSGNAECTASHLHFQLHYPDGTRFNPYHSLLAASRVNPATADEIFFYRSDGLFGYYDLNPDGSLGTPLASGNNYTKGWSTITAIDLDGDERDEMFFYRADGLFRYYDIRPDGSLPKPMVAGDNYTRDWTTITAVDLDGDGQDEVFFYREDGLYRYYDIRPNGAIPKPMQAGNEYTRGWTSITAVDLDGDGQDEMFFYRKDGLYRYYDIKSDGQIGSPLTAGNDYPADWTSITAVDVNGDGRDEMLFYRHDGTHGLYPVSSNGVLGEPLQVGTSYTTGWSSISSVNLDG